MKKSEIVEGVLELMQDDDQDTRNIVNRLVNIVLSDIASRGLLKALQREERTNLVASQRDYQLAANTDKLWKVFVPAWGSDGKLTEKNNDDFLDLMLCDGVTAVGRPQIFTLFGNTTLRVHPLPDTVAAPAVPTDDQKLHIWKYKDIQLLNEEDEISEIKPKHLPAIHWGGYAFGVILDDEVDQPAAEARYERAIGKLFFDQDNYLDRARATRYQDL